MCSKIYNYRTFSSTQIFTLISFVQTNSCTVIKFAVCLYFTMITKTKICATQKSRIFFTFKSIFCSRIFCLKLHSFCDHFVYLKSYLKIRNLPLTLLFHKVEKSKTKMGFRQSELTRRYRLDVVFYSGIHHCQIKI